MDTVNNMRAIKVKYLAPTNYKGSRIKIIEERFERVDTFTMPFNYAIGNGTEQAIQHLQNKGINLIGKAEVKGETILFSDSWKYDNKEFINIK